MSKQRDKGTKLESQVVKYLRSKLPFQEIERKALSGSKDQGDIRGFRIRGLKCVIECKNCKKFELSKWMDEAEEERANADAEFAFVVFKRPGKGEAQMGETFVLTTLEDLAAIAYGSRELMEGD